MDATVISTIDSMATTTIGFAQDVVTEFWVVFLSIGFMIAVAYWLKRKARV